MKFCPNCKATYADDANFCPQESCATPQGPQRLLIAAAPPPPASTETKARFQLGPRLGGGNTGDVYRATDTVTGAQIAYKIVASDVLPNAAAFARAEREFKQLMRVQSPRIASIIDCGRAPDERLYVAMELAEGDSLDKLLRGEPLPLDRAKTVVAQIGQALLEAQKAGIVHRDVAPKNVLVMPTGEVKVINFPLAKPINDRASGVAAYLSPEQVQGKPVDQRSNTYNLAALLYHLLTGEPPFQGTPETVLELHVGSPPLAPSQRRPEAGLPPEVDRVILKALDKSSSRRHLTLRLFLSEVESLVMPTVAPAASPAGAGREGPGGFARTMLFAGGQAEVANLVAKAIAARGGSPAGGVPITPAGTMIGSGPTGPIPGASAPVTTPAAGNHVLRRHPTPASASAPPSGNATLGVAATIASPPPATGAVRLVSPPGGNPSAVSPAPSPANTGANRVLTPPSPAVVAATQVNPASFTTPAQAPVAATPVATPPSPTAAPVASIASASNAAPASGRGSAKEGPMPAEKGEKGEKGKEGKDGKFRETLWFKKGDVEHMIAEARAKIASPEGKAAEAPSPDQEVLPIEDRYVDDGTVTAEDRKKFSLRAGHTAASLPAVKGKVPGESMTDAEVIREVSTGSRKVVVLLVVVVLVLAAAAAVITLMRGGKPTPPPALPPAASLVPAPPAAVPPNPAAGAALARPSEKKPSAPELKSKKIVAAPPSKRTDSGDKRATRRKSTKRR